MDWNEKDINIAINMLNNGNNFKEIGNKLNRTSNSVTKKLHRLGYKSYYKQQNGEDKYKKIIGIKFKLNMMLV